MSSSPLKPGVCLGFLTVAENADLGCVGGYLLLNSAGRPLEFHCTAPVTANRTQQILYGPTLKSYLYGEVIGQALLAKSKLQPIVVCTDSEALLAAREFASTPLVLVLDGTEPRSDIGFELGKNSVATAPRFAADREAILTAWPSAMDNLDLLEPFARIREALEEAQQAGRRAA
jgi:hypothetical protein